MGGVTRIVAVAGLDCGVLFQDTRSISISIKSLAHQFITSCSVTNLFYLTVMYGLVFLSLWGVLYT